MSLTILIKTFFISIILCFIFFSDKSGTVVLTGSASVMRRSISLDHRYPEPFVNEVFKKNILLTLRYMSGNVKNKNDIDWNKINDTYNLDITLYPEEIFAFHDITYPQFKKDKIKTTNAHFNAKEGFLPDGYLYGDGVCHLASLMYWGAKEFGLSAKAPVNHDFALVPQVPREFGVSIYSLQSAINKSQRENLYIQNNFKNPVTFSFFYKNGVLSLSVKEIS